MSFDTGDTIGSYRLVAECGKGAYGSVFLAESTVTRRRYALKIVCRQGRNCERELRGLTSYQAICRHTDLLQVYHVEDCGDYFYYTMDAADNLLDGGNYIPDTLANRLRASGRLSAEAVRRMADELTGCLNTLHARGVLHRDVKPDNILWIDGAAKLGDIGLVTADWETGLAGTPGFLPSEVLAGNRDYEPRDDFYALGKAIYCALSGNPVEEYPSFPDSRTLGDCGDLVLLYNRLCGGELPSESGPNGKSFRGRAALVVAMLTLTLFCSGMVIWFVSRQKSADVFSATVAAEPQSAVVQQSDHLPVEQTMTLSKNYDMRKLDFVCELPSWFTTRTKWYKACSSYLGIDDHPKVAAAKNIGTYDKQSARAIEVGALLRKYAVSPEFLDIFPNVIGEVFNAYSMRPQGNYDFYTMRELNVPEEQFESAMCFVSYYTEDALRENISDDLFRGYCEDLKKILVRRKKLEPVLLRKYKNEKAETVTPQKILEKLH